MQVRAWTIAKVLAAQGHQVTVLTEIPNHPSGVVQPGYRGKLWVREIRERVEVVHLWVKTSAAKNFHTRMAFYLSYMVMAIMAGLWRGRFDVIFANSPPLFVAIAGWFISLLRGIPFVMEVQDLWPESAVVLGELKNPRFIHLAEWFEAKCYQRASQIVSVTQGISDRLTARGVPAAKVVLIPNGSNIDIFQPDPEAGLCLRAELGLQNKFIALYAGIHGLAQGLETLFEAAGLLSANEPDIQFVFVGEGPKKAELLALKDQLGLSNVLMLPGQALERVAGYLSMADVALVPLRKVDLFLGALPTKMFDAWACQKPTLISVDGEARTLLEQVGAGIFIEPEQPEALAQALRCLRHKPDTLAQMGLKGRQVVLERYSLQAAAQQIETILKKTANH